MRKNTQRLFIIEIVLAVLILVIAFSVSNFIFIRSMAQHQENQAIMRISEEMILISEDIKSLNFTNSITKDTEIYYDANGIKQENESIYTLKITLDSKESFISYRLDLYNRNNEKLLSWDFVKVVE